MNVYKQPALIKVNIALTFTGPDNFIKWTWGSFKCQYMPNMHKSQNNVKN